MNEKQISRSFYAVAVFAGLSGALALGWTATQLGDPARTDGLWIGAIFLGVAAFSCWLAVRFATQPSRASKTKFASLLGAVIVNLCIMLAFLVIESYGSLFSAST
ncbi:MAG: hypothetical protein ACSLFF_09935 [Solirubrobacterales bacterium]